jgi:hypothetical protein
MRNAYKILVGKPEGKRELVRYGRRGEDKIKMDLMERGLEGVDCISGSGQGPVPDSCEHGNEPSGSIKGGEFLD